jgi:hypothetical protein
MDGACARIAARNGQAKHFRQRLWQLNNVPIADGSVLTA